MSRLIDRLAVAAVLMFCVASHVYGNFYTRPAYFTLRPSETGVLSAVDRFGPVGIGIELHQPAFVMKVKNVEPGSPAAATGMLKAGQIIESINGERLEGIDPRIQLGNMITMAESKDGIVRLMVRENAQSEPQEVVVQIPVLGSYSESWPLDCAKSDKIVRGLAGWASKQKAALDIAGGPRMLFLLSTGDPEDLAVVGRWVADLAKQYANRETVTDGMWHLGYGGVPLMEYYLRTGDEIALPLIRKVVKTAEIHYMPGGWAQRGFGGLNYYAGGRMNPAGVHIMTALILARECGVEVDENVFQGGLQQYFRFAGRGLLAYGDHRPESGYTDNGRNGALAFTMAAAAAQFTGNEDTVYAGARDISALRGFYTTHRMLHGHSGGGIGEIWRGAAMGLLQETEPLKYQEFMNARMWFYELSRRHDGSFGIIGGERYDDTDWGAGLGLAFTIPRRHLRMAGAPPTKYSQKVVLPERPWGTAADDDFYSLKPATDKQGRSLLVAKERFFDVSASRTYKWAPEAADAGADALRLLFYHPELEIRLMASGQLNRYPALVTELLQVEDARVRRAALEGVIKFHQELLTPEHIAILLRIINDPDESLYVVEGALRALNQTAVEVTLPHLDRLIYWTEHPEWWLSNTAMLILMRTAAQGHAVEKITQAITPVMSANQRYGRWSSWAMGPITKDAVAEAQPALLDLFANVYTAWPTKSPRHPEPQHPENERHFTDSLATMMASIPGGLDKLYTLSQKRFPRQTLAHRDVFLKSEQIDSNPAMQAALVPIVRDELIPQFVAQNRQALENGQKLDELVGLYNRIGVHDYDWQEHGPNRTEMEWFYHSFDPVEQPPLGREKNRLGRYREVSYPKGMENWYKPDFGAASAGWKRGKSPFASFEGQLRPFGKCIGGFCGCGEPPNTLWEKEVLLINGTFEIPPFEEGYLYRVLVGGMSHVGAGDGCRVYANGKEIFSRKTSVDRRAGGAPIGAHIAKERWPDFASGTVNLAATGFLHYHERTKEYGNYLTVFLQRMKLPPMGEAMLSRAAALIPLRSAEWQISQEPDTNVGPDDGKFRWDGVFVPNPAVIGTWQVIGQVDSHDSFAAGAKLAQASKPRFERMTFEEDGSTDSPLWLWSGKMLMDLDEFQALQITPQSRDGKDYLLIEAGGFDTKHGTAWTPPLLVLERQSVKPVKVFILAGDELVLEQGVIDGRTDGVHESFFPHAEKTEDEESKHANAAVYEGGYAPTADYEAMTPVATALVELGVQRSRQIRAGHRGREAIPMQPFPDVAFEDGHTTVVRGWVEVPYDGHYEFRAGEGDSAYNITDVNGSEAYRFEPGMDEARVTPIRLSPGTRHAFRTTFLKQPGHAFVMPMIDKPGALETVVRNNPDYAFLRKSDGSWATRDDVVLFDAHPIHNNTETVGSFLAVGDIAYGGRSTRGMIGVEQMLGHTLGNHFDEPVMLLRFGTHHPTHFLRGSRSLAHDYMPPSSGGGGGENMKWDIIHFNWGIWDIAYRDPKPNDRWHSCVINGTITTTIEQYEENLRELVAKMKATGATLIWGSITPTHPDTPGRKPEDPGRYNAVAAKIMEANGVRINDLYSESIRQGYPKRPDVHSTGNLASKAIEAIEAALSDLENPSKPLPRILLIGDSITGSYQAAVSKHFEGRAEVYKNPGNAEHTGTGLRMIDRWLDTSAYSFNGQEYMELLNSVRKTLEDMDRYYPDYDGRPVELAGLFWFQGIADAANAAMAPAYATHLPNLIHDLRRDLNALHLPAVVVALGWDSRHAPVVREAQLAIGDMVPHAAAIDTRRFVRHEAVSPGGRADMYHQNAEAFLDIGQAMGAQMLDLLQTE